MPLTGKNICFASDFHLGMYPQDESRKREKIIVKWLSSAGPDMRELWLLGDLFDYWFEYRKVVPRGFTRFLGTLASLGDYGVNVHIFSGNHDVWMSDYLPLETGAEIHHSPLVTTMGNKKFYLSHGDGLTNKDAGYRLLKSVFRNRFLQWCYARLHPNGSTAFAQWWSKKSRYSKEMVHPYKGDENEEQIIHARKLLEQDPGIDFFIYGHRHLPFDVEIAQGKRAICLGDWISHFSFGVFDGNEFRLERFQPDPDSSEK